MQTFEWTNENRQMMAYFISCVVFDDSTLTNVQLRKLIYMIHDVLSLGDYYLNCKIGDYEEFIQQLEMEKIWD